jgi:uncharacterized hydantoinase/oxoprolinase family protein
VGEDGTTLTDRDIRAIAEHVFRRQSKLLASATVKVVDRLRRSGDAASPAPEVSVVLSGHGGFLAEEALKNAGNFAEWIRLESVLGQDLSRSAPAYAVASLASETASLPTSTR